MPPKNSCIPQPVFGGYTQTLFLGMSVLDFSATAGWNEQASTVTIKLIRDTCAGPRDYFDDNFNWQQGVNFPNGDPGFNNAPIGSAAFFKVEDFEFAGILQSFNVTEDPGGFPILIVNLISPNILLDGAQVITDEYQGSVLSMPNVFNVYGWLESRTNNCPKVGGFGAPAGGFGNARRNERGIPWYFAKGALQVLLGGVETSDYSWHGGITYKNGLTSNRYGSIPSEGYVVDITDLPTTTDIYYRLTNGSYSLSELISEVCKDGGFEYYVDLVPCKGGATPPITNVIKIRTVSRKSQPALGEISTFITDQNTGPAGRIITQESIGEELRNDSPNSAFIVGAKKKQIYEQTSSSFITPFWGYNDSGGFNTASFTGGQWQITVDVRSLNLSLNTTTAGNTITFSESALLAAMGYSQDAFLSWLQANEPSSNLGTYFFSLLSLNAPFDLNLGAAVGKPATNAARPAGHGSRDPQTTQAQDAQTVFSWLKSYGEQVYGKQWLVAVPWVCYDHDPETNQLLLSDEPSTDGAWPNTLTEVLGMTFPSSYTDFFADEQGKLQTILRFNGAINTSLLSDEDYVTDGTSVWVKGDINEKWALLPSTFFGAQYAAALVTIPNRITISPTVALSQTMYGGPNFRSPTINGNFNPNANPGAVAGPAALPFFAPASAALPVKSNTTTYGPWLATASSLVVNGHPFGGKVYYEQDDGLAPWEYGGFTYMNLGAAAKIDNSITNETVSERGSVTLAGYPEKTLGLAITDSPSLVATRVIQNGLYEGSNYYFVNTGGVSNKAAQITNIQVTVNGSAITTQYQISSFTPVFGRFSKDNAERVKQIGQQRLEFGRKIRAALAKQAKLASGQRKAAIQQFANMLNQSDADTGASWLLTGKRFPTNRNHIVNNTIQGASQFDDYDNAAGMSMDGLLRPVQKNGGGVDLPQEVSSPPPTTKSNKNFTWATPPPLNEYQPILVNTNYLNPFATPSDALTSDSRSNTPDQGHDIGDLFRGKKSDFDGNIGLINIQEINEQGGDGYEQTDYRYLAMRGPVMLNAWGYDMAGKPVPNSNGDSAGSWDSDYRNKTDQFADNWLTDNKLWPTAPIDLRYDRRRGVWTCPPGFRIYEVTVEKPIEPGQPSEAGTCKVTNADDVYDSDGNPITTKTVTVYNNTSTTVPCGTILVYYDDSEDIYWPIFPGSSTKFGNSAPCDGIPSVTEYKDISKLDFGDGLTFEISSNSSSDPNNTDSEACSSNSVGIVKLNLKINSLDAAPHLRFEDTETVTWNVDTTNECVTVIQANSAGGGSDLTILSDPGLCDGEELEMPFVDTITFGRGLHVQDSLGQPFIEVIKEVYAYGQLPWSPNLNDCKPFNAIGGGFGVAVRPAAQCGSVSLQNSCSYVFETDLRIKKVGIECNTQEAGYSDEYGQRFGMLEFGDYLKISNGSTEDAESFRIDVCPPSPLIEAYDCGGNITYSDVLSNLDSLTFDGFNTDLTAANLTIKHEHYVYGGCTRFNDPNADTPYDEALASVGFKFQDLNFGECFKVSKSSANTVNGGIGDCVVDIGLCGETEDVYVVCEVSCTNDGKTTSKQKLTFKDGLLKDVSGCGEAGTSEDKLEAVIENGSQAIVNTDTDLSNVFDGNSLVVYGTAALGSIILHLPPLALIGFAAITIFKADGTSNTVTVRPHSGETFANGDTSHVLTHTEESMQVVSNGLSLLRV